MRIAKNMDTKIKVVFYILNSEGLKSRDLFACRVIEKAYNNNHKIFVEVTTQTEAQEFYNQLWTFRDISFIPHEIYNLNPESNAPVLIGFNALPTNHKYLLINLTQDVPKFYDQYKHIIEIIPNDPELKALGRKRYLFYQSKGCELETHNM